MSAKIAREMSELIIIDEEEGPILIQEKESPKKNIHPFFSRKRNRIEQKQEIEPVTVVEVEEEENTPKQIHPFFSKKKPKTQTPIPKNHPKPISIENTPFDPKKNSKMHPIFLAKQKSEQKKESLNDRKIRVPIKMIDFPTMAIEELTNEIVLTNEISQTLNLQFDQIDYFKDFSYQMVNPFEYSDDDSLVLPRFGSDLLGLEREREALTKFLMQWKEGERLESPFHLVQEHLYWNLKSDKVRKIDEEERNEYVINTMVIFGPSGSGTFFLIDLI